MIRSSEYDVVVVGGGPAGSTTASLLARRGLSVLILDRAVFPRGKACGESVNPGAVAELGRLGVLEDVLRLPHQEVRGWTIHPDHRAAFRGGFPAGVHGLAIDRAAFDHLLLERAVADGAHLRTGTRVTELVFEAGAVAGIRDADGGERRARLVVGADGLRSVVMRRLGLSLRGPALRKVGLTAHLEGAVGRSGEGDLFVLPWGCAGLVRVDDSATNVVLIVEGAGHRRKGERADAWFDRLAAEVPALSNARRVGPVHATGPFDHPTRDVVADGALLVGDAAGYFDPFTGQGIYRALRGARLAADAVERCLVTPDAAPAALRDYANAHRRAFGGGVRVQKVIESVMSRPVLFGIVASGLRSSPALGDRLIGLTGDLPARRESRRRVA